jgi:universal stress protein A
MLPIDRILVGTDFSPPSKHALAHAVALARQTRAELYVVHCFEVPSYGALEGAYIPSAAALAELNARHDAALDAEVVPYRDRGVALHTRLVVGQPTAVLQEQAKELGVSVIVVGSHGRSGLARVLMGSVAERLVRESALPVMVVPFADS